MSENAFVGLKSKRGECDSCDFRTSLLRYSNMGPNKYEKWLCELCAHTMAGTALDFPEQYAHNNDVLKAICYVGNTILERIDKLVGVSPNWAEDEAHPDDSHQLE